MKNIKQVYKALTITVVFLLSSFTIIQLTQDRELIIGTWNYAGETNNKWIFTDDRCIWEYNGEVINTFTYSISEEIADNGIVFSYLKLVRVGNNDVFEYDINALDANNLTLDYQGDLSEKLMLFEKQ